MSELARTSPPESPIPAYRTLTTLNHSINADRLAEMIPAPIVIGRTGGSALEPGSSA